MKKDKLKAAGEVLAEAALAASEKASSALEAAQDEPDNEELQMVAESMLKAANDAIRAAKEVASPVQVEQGQTVIGSEKAIIKARDNVEKARIAAYQKKVDAELKDTVMCKLQNLEDQGVPIEFNYEGRTFKFYDGQETQVPKCVVRHLNKCRTPIHVMKQDPNAPKTEAAVIKEIIGYRNRFSAVPMVEV